MADQTATTYLEQEVLSASPAKLRWLLLRKSVNLCQVIADMWRAGQTPVAAQWSLRLREILSELLSGIHGKDALAKQVADLYVFMLAVLTEAERDHDTKKIEQLQALLEIEAETWRLVQQDLAGELPIADRLGASPTATSSAPTPKAATIKSNNSKIPAPIHKVSSLIESSLCIDA